MENIYIYGASGHGLVVADIAKACGYVDVVFIDDGMHQYPNFESICENTNIPIAVAVGDNQIRSDLVEKVEHAGMVLASLIHPSASVSESADIKKGTVIMPQVVVNAHARVGKGCILNTSCVVEHEDTIDDFVHISPSVSLAGNVSIGKNTHIGMGSTVKQGVYIGEQSIIGMGSVVLKNIPSFRIAYGNPCVVKGVNNA